jgi:hypothetical protein
MKESQQEKKLPIPTCWHHHPSFYRRGEGKWNKKQPSPTTGTKWNKTSARHCEKAVQRLTKQYHGMRTGIAIIHAEGGGGTKKK